MKLAIIRSAINEGIVNSPHTSRYLFTYGTLRKHIRPDFLNFEASSRFLGMGTVQAQLYDLGHYPCLVRSENPADRVIGEVYEIHEEELEDVLTKLDRYEGVNRIDPDKGLYRRELLEVRLEDGRTLQAWAYIYNQNIEGARRIPHGDYEKYIFEEKKTIR